MIDKLIEQEGNTKQFEYKGYECLIFRAKPDTLGHLCGYVKLPKTHKYFNKSYDNIQIEVHGGLTYSGMSETGGEYFTEGYWIGFDCAHFGDLVPVMNNNFPSFLKEDNVPYRDMEYVEQEIKNMVDQLL